MEPLYKLKDIVYNIKYGIRNFLKYCKIIWRDRDWDFAFLYYLLEFKLKNIRLHIEKHNILENSEKVCQSIRICENLIQRLLDENYNQFLKNNHIEKWGELIFKSTSDKKIKTLGYSKCSNKEEEMANAEMMSIYLLDNKAYKRDEKLLFSILEKYISSWWD